MSAGKSPGAAVRLLRVIVLILPLCGAGAAADTLRLGGMLRCPWVCGDRVERPGILVEIATRALELHGHRVDFEALPWSRALKYVRLGRTDAIAGVLRRNAPGLVYPRQPQAISQLVFVTRQDRPWRYSGLVSLWQVRIGVTQDISYGSMDSYIRRYRDSPRVQALSGESAILQNLKALQFRRIDVMLEDRMVLNYYRQQLHDDVNLKERGQLTAENLYIAFYPGQPQAQTYAKQLSDGMDRLRESGKLDALYRKYGVGVPASGLLPGVARVR